VTGYDADARDPGLTAERTDLAWNRSGLSMLACGAVVLRGIGRPPLASGDLAVGVCILALGAVTWALGAWRVHRTRSRGTRATTTADLLPISLGVTLVGLAAFALGLVAPG
jgi:uncharacterized membrane protein YidH (DUF202 family)